MPSSSAKQRRFMQAIAHSPSFAKKAGVPQSVGKDFAAADKTFKKGGEVKESKAMVEKEVAFMKKKGAPKSMIKHEEAEGMKRGGNTSRMNRLEELGRVDSEKAFTPKGKKNLVQEKSRIVGELKNAKKVRRMADGGDVDMSMGSGDPFAKPRNYEAEKEQGARTLKGIKSFLGFGDKEEPVEEVKSSPVRATRSSAAPSATPAAAPAATSRVTTTPAIVKKPESDEDKPRGPQFANSVSDRGEGEYSGDGLSPVKKPVIKRKPVGVEKIVKKERVITEPVDTSRAAIEERRATERKLAKPETKSASKFGLASDETRESIRKGLGSVLNFLDLSKAHEREFGKKMAKGGDVKKMAQGGYAKADGIASRGKTQPKMVKMAGGGFVKSADGCAQRGKTRASQVKMSRGGKC